MIRETESDALRVTVGRERLVTSVIAEVELLRAVRRRDSSLLGDALGVIAEVSLVDVSEGIRARASRVEPAAVRALDALHLATALEVADKVEHFVTYDVRRAAAAQRAGLSVLAPGA